MAMDWLRTDDFQKEERKILQKRPGLEEHINKIVLTHYEKNGEERGVEYLRKVLSRVTFNTLNTNEAIYSGFCSNHLMDLSMWAYSGFKGEKPETKEPDYLDASISYVAGLYHQIGYHICRKYPDEKPNGYEVGRDGKIVFYGNSGAHKLERLDEEVALLSAKMFFEEQDMAQLFSVEERILIKEAIEDQLAIRKGTRSLYGNCLKQTLDEVLHREWMYHDSNF